MSMQEHTIASSDKAERSPVTSVDRALAQMIRESLLNHYPTDAVITEEDEDATTSLGERLSSGRVWCVDPVDGTTNLTRGLELVTTSLALLVDGNPVIGCIGHPPNHIVSNTGGIIPRMNRALSDAVVACDWPRSSEWRREFGSLLGEIGATVRSVRVFGSAAYGMSLLAQGRIDAYFHPSTEPWDVAAGVAIARYQGLTCWDTSGTEWTPCGRGIISGIPNLCEAIAFVMQKSALTSSIQPTPLR